MLRQLKGTSGGDNGVGGDAQSAWDTGVACKVEDPAQPQCAEGNTCSYFDLNPSHNLMSFDNVGVAFQYGLTLMHHSAKTLAILFNAAFMRSPRQ